jgi:thioredoxin reductase (NADPH)
MLDILIWIAVGLLTVGIPMVYIRRSLKKEATAAQILQKAQERGQDEPVSLHPFIDPAICIGSGACVKACPEVNVLGLINNRGVLINPSHCIGHGQCAAACPVGAITLVFGTEKRGVDIPVLNGNFETNVSGIFIAGELGGMGLIRNAVTQGKEAMEAIARSLFERSENPVFDVIIVGAGPAGMAATLQAQKEQLRFLSIEQDDLGGTILTYPRRKLVMTRPMDLPLYGLVKASEIAKENLVELFTSVFRKHDLRINSGEKVNDIQRKGKNFVVTTSLGTYETQRVLLAIGRRGSPRKLNVPGEKSAKVAYRLLEPEKFDHLRVLVVGGGDSAVESVLALAEQPGNTVSVSYRREGFFRLKEGNQTRVDAAIKQKQITTFFNSEVTSIEADKVHLTINGQNVTLENDFVFVFAGGELPTEFLKKIGIEFQRKHGER